MKSKLFGAALLVLSAGASPAQQITPPVSLLPHCYAEVTGVADQGEIERIWETSWGSYIRDRFEGKVLKVRVGTTSRTGGAATIQCFWIGTQSNSRITMYGKETKTVNIPPAYFAEFYVASPEVKNHIQHLVLARRHSEHGISESGWIVSVTNANSQSLAVKASSESLLKLFQDQQAFAKIPVSRP